MSIEKTSQVLSIKSEKAETTEKIGEYLGVNLKGGEVIILNSDLGGGKTTFVRGLMRGMGSTDRVTSPSFKISNTYKAGPLVINHFDFYRLQEPGLLMYELSDLFGDENVVTIIEWAEIVQDILPDNRVEIRILTIDEHKREFLFNYSDSNAYVVNKIKDMYKL